MSVHFFTLFYPNLLICCIFEMYRKTRVFSEMLVSGIRGNLLVFGFLNTILELVFASYEDNNEDHKKTTMKIPNFFLIQL